MALVQHFVHWGTSFSPVSEIHWAWSAQSPPECGTLCILELIKHARRFPDVYQHPATRRSEGSCQRTGPILDGMVPSYPALPCLGAGFFRKRHEGVWRRGHPGPVHPPRSASSPRASRPTPQGFGRSSRAIASSQTRYRSGGSFQWTPASAGDS